MEEGILRPPLMPSAARRVFLATGRTRNWPTNYLAFPSLGAPRWNSSRARLACRTCATPSRGVWRAVEPCEVVSSRTLAWRCARSNAHGPAPPSRPRVRRGNSLRALPMEGGRTSRRCSSFRAPRTRAQREEGACVGGRAGEFRSGKVPRAHAPLPPLSALAVVLQWPV